MNVFLFVFTLISVQGENRFGLMTKFRSWVVYILTHSVSFIKQLFKIKTSLSVLVDSHQNHNTVNIHSNINLLQSLIKASRNTSEAADIVL